MTRSTASPTPRQKRLLEQTLERLMPNPPRFEWVGTYQCSRPIPEQARSERSSLMPDPTRAKEVDE